MMRVMVHVCLVLATFSACGQSSNEPTGSICGMVQDENGAPASFVKVVAKYVGPGGHTGSNPMSKTDQFGHYCVANLVIGDYVMSADDPEKGYPQMETLFYSSHSLNAKITITSQTLEGHADWQIPYKAGFLTVHLTDARTGKQIIPMFFNLVVRSRRDVGFMRGSSRSTMALLVPPNEDIDFTVSAPGYGEWPGDGTQGRLVNLLPGTTQDFAIALQPIDP
jgi:hypothetical protein